MDRFIVVDFETTGTHPKNGDTIIQIGAVVIEDGQILDQYTTLVNPNQPIPPFITSLTGITDEMVADAPSMEEVLPDFLRYLDGRTFVAHNASFDLNFLQEALLGQGYYPFDGYVLDTVELARFLLPMQESYRLVELADSFDIQHENPHQADSDALATSELLLHLLLILKEMPLITIQRLQMLVNTFRSDIGALLRHVEMEKMMTCSFDPEAPTEQSEDENWDTYRQIALRKQKKHWIETKQTFAHMEIDVLLESLMGEGGALHRENPSFQRRDEQEAMIRAIYAAMDDEVHLFAEAGTGTGKSLAYLIPSILWAKLNQEQVVISTHTIQLQEQLFAKDIPLLQKVLPFDMRAAQLKGRGNYLCLRKFEQTLNDSSDSSHEVMLAKAQIVTWLTQTETGDYEEISLPPAASNLWQQVKSDTHSCLHRHCPWFSRCFYYQAKERAREADLIIVNHALLVSDMDADGGIIPKTPVVIIDEAHQLEEVASQHLGIEYSTAQLMYLLERLETDQEQAILNVYSNELNEWDSSLSTFVQEQMETIRRTHIKARETYLQWSQLLYHWALKRAKETIDIGRATVRYRVGDFSDRNARIITSSEKCKKELAELGANLEELLAPIQKPEKPLSFGVKRCKTDLEGIVQDVKRTIETIHTLLIQDDADLVKWMEIESRTSRKHLFLYALPLHIGQTMREQFFAEKRSVILTSATLTVKNSYDYLLERLGFDANQEQNYRTVTLPSPFDYEQQGLLLLPSDLPSISENERMYLDAVTQGCVDVVRAAEGRTMILFTSYSMLRQVYEGMKQLLSEEEGYTLLGHGIDSSNRSKLVRNFQRESKAVLLGTSSFWEGVDIPGKDLSCLVIVRLPFTPPNHPLLEGRSERLKEEKKNPFMSLSLPQAIIRFKQGVGRLIRHHMDQGVIVVFDSRIVESRYGRSFLASLPPFQTKTGPWVSLREMITPFLDPQKRMVAEEES
ncbi:ATP-dependent DNA helicase DinG [Brevibacillus sp. SYSU BS000544]|uniref:ATP-dependent DNA helicase DinG n=1 Tax=Brevibacillus sp. SYSU BS000544 TaxID=3416443 RepID=UPI003CE4703D